MFYFYPEFFQIIEANIILLMYKELKNLGPCQRHMLQLNPEISNLHKQVQRSMAENKKIYSQILKINQTFNHIFYQPINPQGIQPMFLKPLLFKQIDKLNLEKQVLLKKKELAIFREKEQANKKQSFLKRSTNHYSFLRSTWTRFQEQPKDNIEKIDNLNKIVGMIKTNIKKMGESQNNCVQNEMNTDKNSRIENRSIMETIERLKMRNEQLQMFCFQYQQTIEQKNRLIQDLEKQLQLTTLDLKKAAQNHQKHKTTVCCHETQIYQMKGQKHLSHVFKDVNREFEIDIFSSGNIRHQVQFTNRTLEESLEFLKMYPLSLKTDSKVIDQTEPSDSIPELNLNHTQSYYETYTERYLSQSLKLISLESQRSCFYRNQKRVLNSSENEQEEREKVRERKESRKFKRKIQGALTSDRQWRKQKDISMR